MQNQNYLFEVVDDTFVLEKLYTVNHNKIVYYSRLIIDDCC